MKAEILDYDGLTRLDIPVSKVLKSAREAKMERIIVIGYDKYGDFYFSSSKADGGDVLWLLEVAKMELMRL